MIAWLFLRISSATLSHSPLNGFKIAANFENYGCMKYLNWVNWINFSDVSGLRANGDQICRASATMKIRIGSDGSVGCSLMFNILD